MNYRVAAEVIGVFRAVYYRITRVSRNSMVVNFASNVRGNLWTFLFGVSGGLLGVLLNFCMNGDFGFGYGFVAAPSGALLGAIFDKNLEKQYSMLFVLIFSALLIGFSR